MSIPLRFLCVLCCAASLIAPHLVKASPTSSSSPLRVDVLDTLILGEPRIDGLKIAELSGLVHDRERGTLYAVSDKGRLFAFSLDLTGGKIAALQPLSGHTLVDANGNALRDQGFNAEGLALAALGTLAIVSEDGPRIARFSTSGKWIGDMTVPAALTDPAAQRSPKDGLESLALHPRLGLLTAPEEPLAAQVRTTQTIYSAAGRKFAYDTTDIGTTSIKGMESLADGRVLLLERDVAEDGRLITWLRLLDAEHCMTDQLCSTDVAKVNVPDISDADFEGLAQVADDLFLIVSDDKIGKDHRSVFALLKVTLPSRQ